MSQLKRTTLLFTFLVGLGCAPKIQQVQFQSKTKELFSSEVVDHPMDTLVGPYRESLNQEMNAPVGTANCTMSKSRPESALGNFAADLLQEYAERYFKDSLPNIKIITLLNNGGLRAPINEGQILLRNVYELMPFDNVIVFVKVRSEKYAEMMAYLEDRGGEPIAGFRKDDPEIESDFWIATSDYLAAGGDKMTFFKDPLMVIDTGRFLRDEIKAHIENSGEVCTKTDGRWH